MKTSKTIKRVFALAFIIILFVVTEISFSILLKPVTYADYFNNDIEEFIDKGAESDMIFIGASRTYRSFIPQIFEDELGIKNVINAGSSSQPYSSSYYQLLDLLKTFTPKHVVLGVTGDKLVEKELTQGKLIVYDRLTDPFIKMNFMLECLQGKDKLYILDSYRYRENLSINYIKNNIIEKKIFNANDTKSDNVGTEYYADTGFVYSYSTYEEGNIPISGEKDYSKNNFLEENIEWLDKIVNVCKQKNIELHLVVGPMSLMRMYNIDNYQDADDFYSEYAEKNDIDYQNLNLLKNRESFLPDSLMHDYNHVNGEGAKKISIIYADILRSKFEGISLNDLFYDTIDDLKKDIKRIVAVKAEIDIDENNICVEPISLQSDDIVPEYRIQISVDGREFNVISDFSIKTKYNIKTPEGNNVSIRIDARNSKEPDQNIAYQIYEYDLP